MKPSSNVIAICLVYAVFAILLNSVGTVILQSINSFGISKTEASVLEGLKDLPIAAVGFMIAAFLPKIGYKKGLIAGVCLATVAAIIMPLFPSFLTTKLSFFLVGCAFGVVKVAVYSIIGLITDNQKSHASTTNYVEAVFMVGVLTSYWIFSYFIDPSNSQSLSWLNAYWVIGIITLIALVLVVFMPLNESSASKTEPSSLRTDFLAMVMLLRLPLIYTFLVSAFIYVLIEQGIGSWLPTFNNEIFKLPTDMSVQFASIYAAALALGRFGAAAALAKVNWYPVLNLCIIGVGIIILIVIPATQNIQVQTDISWLTAPWQVYLLPAIGLLLAPIYPAIISVMLSSLPQQKHSSVMGLVVIFSALGGTFGSIVMGIMFEEKGGEYAFYLLLIPTTIILISLFFLKRHIDGSKNFT